MSFSTRLGPVPVKSYMIDTEKPGSFGKYFHVQIKKTLNFVNPKNFSLSLVFFWCRQDQTGTGGTDLWIHFF